MYGRQTFVLMQNARDVLAVKCRKVVKKKMKNDRLYKSTAVSAAAALIFGEARLANDKWI